MTTIQAIDVLKGLEQSLDDYCELNDEGKTAFRMAITALEVFGLSEQLPSAQPERKKGKWISVKGSNGKDYHKCSECLHTQDITGVKNYCSVCGAEMMGVQDE